MLFYVSKDDGTVTAIAAASGVPTEVDSTNAKGLYKIALSQSETNADKLLFTGKSSTTGIVVVPMTIYTLPPLFSSLSVDSSGRIDIGKALGTAVTLDANNVLNVSTKYIAGSSAAATALMTQMGAQNVATINDVSPAVGAFKGASSLSAVDNEYTGQILALASGTQAGIARKITGYTGSTRLFAFATPFPAAPADGDSFVVLGFLS